jgi:CRP-like cAMP-binding protein
MSVERDSSLAEFLSTCRLFATLEREDRLILARSGARRRLNKEQVIHRRGERAGSLVVILSGQLEIRRPLENGDEAKVRTVGSGAVIGLSPALGAAHSADVVAAVESEVLVIPASALREAFRKDPQIAVRAILQLAAWLADVTDELESLRASDVFDRTRRKLYQLAKGQRELRITHEELAAHVGASRANVSRALKRLEKAGTVRLGRGRVVMTAVDQ